MTLSNLPLLSMLIWTPIIGGVWALIAGDRQEQTVKFFSLLFAIITFVFSALLYYQFDNGFEGMQFIEESSWIPAFNIKYHLGVDGIALPLILLTTFTTILVILAAWEVIEKNISYYMCAFLVLTGLMNGVFVAAGCHPVLCVLGSNVDSDVSNHRDLGRAKPGLCYYQVFPVYLPGFSIHVGGVSLSLFCCRQF